MIDSKLLKENFSYIVPASIALISLYLLSQSKQEEKRGLKEIPHAPTRSLPIFGQMLSLGLSPSKVITKWHEEVGPIYKINMGNQLWIAIADPYLAHEIFAKSGSVTSSRPYHRFANDMYGRHGRGIVFSEYGPIWKNNRKAALATLRPAAIDKYSEVLEFEIEDFMKRIAEIEKKGEAFDPCRELQLTSMNVILTVLCAKRFTNTEDPTYRSILSVVERGVFYGGIAGDLGSYLPSLSWIGSLFGIQKSLKNLLNDRDTHYEKLIKDALESDKDCIAKELYKLKEIDNSMTVDDILVIASDLNAAGTDTTSNTLYWAFAILSQYPEVQTRIVKELDEWRAKYPNRKSPSFHMDREHFPYAICVQKEVMRFRPVTTFGVPHACIKDTVVDGYLIPKGTALISSMTAMHHNPVAYEDPEVFRPERFLDNTQKMSVSANANVDERDHFGFGWGRRLCPGIYLSEVETFNFYTHFFSKYTIQPGRDAQGNPLKVDLMDHIEEGIVIKPTLDKYIIVPHKK
ncbi:cytochrome P450 [Sporodiniella umbellata]|nr:cytochrome P450 [Sporodiniella umbellata]